MCLNHIGHVRFQLYTQFRAYGTSRKCIGYALNAHTREDKYAMPSYAISAFLQFIYLFFKHNMLIVNFVLSTVHMNYIV